MSDSPLEDTLPFDETSIAHFTPHGFLKAPIDKVMRVGRSRH